MRLRKLLCAMTASAVLLGGTFPAAAYEGTQMQTQVQRVFRKTTEMMGS